jgi:hydroxymethylbilane synthase
VTRIRIGTRGSALALAQSNWVKARIEEHDPGVEVELRVIKTSGDRLIDTPIPDLGGKGVFTKEIEEALLRGDIDLAVHSMKDLPPDLPQGLVIAAVSQREDARDVLVTRMGTTLADLSSGATIGTGSLRRRAQLLHCRRDLSIVPLRGNVDTRLRKLDEGQVEALVMAAAGLKRIGRADRIVEYLADEICVSAVAQGALGIESQEASSVRDHVAFLNDPATCTEVAAERALLERLGGDCHVPIGARARLSGTGLKLVSVVAGIDGMRLCRSEMNGAAAAAAELGRRVAEDLLRRGAGELLGAG